MDRIMKKKMFFVWNMEEEKKWLEDQAKNGLILVEAKFGKYYFEQSEPQDLVYDFDFQMIHKSTEDEYLEFFEDWTKACRFGGWYYFYKPRENSDKDKIYSDYKSKKSMFTRLMGFLALVGFPLIYQSLIIFPNMDPTRFDYPSFYFFFRIIIYVFFVLYILAFANVFLIYRSYNSKIRE